MKKFKLEYWALENGKKVLKSKEVTVEAYKHAAEKGMNLRQYARHLANDWDPSMGDPLDQMYSSSGLFDSKKFGMPGLTLKDLASETLAAGFRRNDGDDTSLSARLLFPQLILETMNENLLRDDGSDILAIWEDMIAVNRNVNGTRVDQPTINTAGPEESRSGRITQLAEPETMVTISVGERSYRIPTNSIGLMIADEAMEATTIDLVRVVMEAQSRGDKIRRVNEMVKAMVYGDKDLGIDALPQTKASSFDPSITSAGQITKRAYIKWLHSKQKTANISYVMTDIDTALDLDEQLLPTQTGQDASKIVTPFGGMNLNLTVPNMVPFDADMFGTGVLVGMDPRYAIQRTVNVNASYEAIEQYVMRKATGFRVDYGETASRLYDEAWSVLNLTV